MGTLGIISDMDGVIYRGRNVIPGAQDFIDRLRSNDVGFVFLTNNSEQTPLDLLRKLAGLGIRGLTEQNFITSAMATAEFLASQKPNGTAYVVGGGGLSAELYKIGYSITDMAPDYVVVGKTASFGFPMMRKAAQLIDDGAKFIGTNPDMVDPVEGGTEPAAGALLASIEAATGMKPYIIGKPQLADDDLREADARRAAGGLRDDRRSDGHRHRRRPGGRHADGARALRGVDPGIDHQVSLPPDLRLTTAWQTSTQPCWRIRLLSPPVPGRARPDGHPHPVAAPDQAGCPVQTRKIPTQERL